MPMRESEKVIIVSLTFIDKTRRYNEKYLSQISQKEKKEKISGKIAGEVISIHVMLL